MQRFKDCLRIAWAGKQMEYCPPYSLTRNNFFQDGSSKQKSFYLLARELQDECSASISVEIICFEHLQQGSYKKLNPGIFFQEYLNPNTSEVATIMVLWKMITVFCSSSWNFSSPHYITCFVCHSLQVFTEKVTS